MNATDKRLQSEWRTALEALGARAAPRTLARLLAAWSEPHRHYHTLQHLDECLLQLAAWSEGRPRHEVAVALWFHDAVYDPYASDNEVRSAELARVELAAAAAPPDAVERVVRLVLATRHGRPPSVPMSDDERLLVDVDLAILGAAPPRFAQYERQIRHEYASVPAEVFRERRGRFLAGLLGRPHLYLTPRAQDELEAQARANLAGLLAAYDAASE